MAFFSSDQVAAERQSSASAAATVSYELPEAKGAAAVGCSAWFGCLARPPHPARR
jgi:hypothetical protein